MLRQMLEEAPSESDWNGGFQRDPSREPYSSTREREPDNQTAFQVQACPMRILVMVN